MIRINIPMTDDIEKYIDRVAYRDHPALAACRNEAQTRGQMAMMQVAPEQAAFLQMLIGLLSARRVLEIGTFTGYSALAMALSLPEGGKLTTLDISEEYVGLARTFWEQANVADRIEAIIGDAAKSLDDLIRLRGEGSFDLIVIDADKPGYPAYYEKALRLVRSGGVIVVDDTLIHGRVVTGPLATDPDYVGPATDAVRALNETIHAQASVEMVLMPWRDGLTLVRKL
ncbi:O-methyltransferase [Brucella intermedia]|uniref:O-methyltransferase n=3 Tax=Alphaproteobacteria TaxID=28211 RepID=A0A3D9XZ49_PARVE|nr:class I SAM-dependent methyltransferase [Brucella intermedia]MDH0126936.1 class I SAM-dependent methyltransferase [Brucella intermedia GD04153]REF73572.1 O-methyltransferase [Paracoccus versutus]